MLIRFATRWLRVGASTLAYRAGSLSFLPTSVHGHRLGLWEGATTRYKMDVYALGRVRSPQPVWPRRAARHGVSQVLAEFSASRVTECENGRPCFRSPSDGGRTLRCRRARPSSHGAETAPSP